MSAECSKEIPKPIHDIIELDTRVEEIINDLNINADAKAIIRVKLREAVQWVNKNVVLANGWIP